jgi:hypothetical protein
MYLSDAKDLLLKSGFLPEEELTSYQKWIDVSQPSFSISFYFIPDRSSPVIDGTFSVHETCNEIIQHVNDLEAAIYLSRVELSAKR